MKRIIAVLITVLVLVAPFTLSASALSQGISGSAYGSSAIFYITVSDRDMHGCKGSFSVSGGTISSIGLAGNGTLTVSGYNYTYSGSSSATIVVVCHMTGNSITLTSREATVLDSQNREIGIADRIAKSVAAPEAPTTTTTNAPTTVAPIVDNTTTTTTTTEASTEAVSEEETSEDKTTTTTTEIIIAPTKPKTQNNNGSGLSSKLLIAMVVVVAAVLLFFAIGILLGKRRNDSIKYTSGESIEDILGDVEDKSDQ